MQVGSEVPAKHLTSGFDSPDRLHKYGDVNGLGSGLISLMIGFNSLLRYQSDYPT